MAHILVVEDEETIRNLICWNLEMVGHSCDMAADGWEAKKMMESGQFDLISVSYTHLTLPTTPYV